MKTAKWLPKIKNIERQPLGKWCLCVYLHTARVAPAVSCSCHVRHINKRPSIDPRDLAKLQLQLLTHKQQVYGKEKAQAAGQRQAASAGASSQTLRNSEGGGGRRGQRPGLLNIAEAGYELTHHVF